MKKYNEKNSDVIITVRSGAIYRARRAIQHIAYRIFGAVTMSKFYYRFVMKRKLNLKNPNTFTEKINWYKLYYCPKNELIIKCSDKYNVRNFIKEKGLESYLSEIIGVWDKPEEITWGELPQKFVLKISNGCGYNIICKNKDKLKEIKTKKLLKKWLKEHFGFYNAEPHYEKSEKKIICEKYIESEKVLPIDYKIHCMNGMPKVIQLCDERTKKDAIYKYYDTEKNPFSFGKYPDKSKLKIPDKIFEEMIEVCKKIAINFPYVRIDFFINKGKIQISELTFSPSAGLKLDLNYGNGDYIMGDMLDFEGVLYNVRKI